MPLLVPTLADQRRVATSSSLTNIRFPKYETIFQLGLIQKTRLGNGNFTKPEDFQPMRHCMAIQLVPVVVAAIAGLTMFFVIVILNTSVPLTPLGNSQSPILGRNTFLHDRETIQQSIKPMALPPSDSSNDMLVNNNNRNKIPVDINVVELMGQLNFKRATMPIKDLVRDGIEHGLIVIVNVSTKEEIDNVYLAASQHRASSRSWDIHGALDGSLGDLLAELMEEVHIVDELHNSLTPTIPDCSKHNNNIPDGMKVTATNHREPSSALATNWPYKLQVYGKSLHSVIVFSSYRFSDTEFFVVVLLGLSEKSPSKDPVPEACAWMQKPEETQDTSGGGLGHDTNNYVAPMELGTKSTTVTNEPSHEFTSYDVAVIKCAFEDPAGANGKEGDLYMKIQTNEFVPVFQQKPEEIYGIQFEGPLQYQFAYCSPLILGLDLTPEHLKEWFMYHHFLFHVRKTHYFIYHGIDLGAEVMKVLRPLLNNGLVTLIDLRSAGRSNLLPGQYPSHHLAMNDCLHRARYLADWVFFWSFEEYLWVAPPQTLPGLLDTYSNTPWISFGRMEWSSEYCCAQKESLNDIVKTWAVDRLCFRMEHPTCGGNTGEHVTMCSGNEGRRKWIANPRLVFAAGVHLVLEPPHSGVTLNTSVARINHYSLKTSQIKDCKEVKVSVVNGSATTIDGTWWKDTSIAKYTQAAHKYVSTSKIFNSSFVNPSPTWPPDVPKNAIHGTSLNSSDIGSLLVQTTT